MPSVLCMVFALSQLEGGIVREVEDETDACEDREGIAGVQCTTSEHGVRCWTWRELGFLYRS